MVSRFLFLPKYSHYHLLLYMFSWMFSLFKLELMMAEIKALITGVLPAMATSGLSPYHPSAIWTLLSPMEEIKCYNVHCTRWIDQTNLSCTVGELWILVSFWKATPAYTQAHSHDSPIAGQKMLRLPLYQEQCQYCIKRACTIWNPCNRVHGSLIFYKQNYDTVLESAHNK